MLAFFLPVSHSAIAQTILSKVRVLAALAVKKLAGICNIV
jgi:hypothetical protein